MSDSIESTDRSSLNMVVRDASTGAAERAARIGETPAHRVKRIPDVAAGGLSAGYRTVRGFSNPDEKPSVIVLLIERNRAMSGTDVLRSVQFIPEVLSCEVADGAFDMLLRLRVTSEERVDEIQSFFSQQVGVNSVTVAR